MPSEKESIIATATGQVADNLAPTAKAAQIMLMIKDNQLVTAVVLFILWQAGALSQGFAIIGGVC